MANISFVNVGSVPAAYQAVDMFAYTISFAQQAYPGAFVQNYAGLADSLSFTVPLGGSGANERVFLYGEDITYDGLSYGGHATGVELVPYNLYPGPNFSSLALTGVNIDVSIVLGVIATPSAADDLNLLRSLLSGNDMITLGNGSDTAFGGSGGDIMMGYAGADTLYGDAGNDLLVGGEGADAMSGASGSDTASYVTAVGGVIVALDGSLAQTGDAAGDLYLSIENLEGTGFADTLVGDIRSNAIHSGSGDDVLWGRGGIDTLAGGGGHDVIYGGAGADNVNLGTGFDRIGFESLGQRGDKVAGFGGDDQFLFKRSGFGSLDLGVIDVTVFRSGTTNAAGDAGDRFIFRTTDHTLWYDADGSGATAAVMIADLQSAHMLQSEQIFIVG